MNSDTFRLSAASVALLCFGFAAPVAAVAQQGVITGRVTDQATELAVVGAQVLVVGTTRSALTDREGRYRLENVSPGTVELRVRMIGYAVSTRSVTVTAGQEVMADIVLAQSAVALDAVVVTATGLQRARELGHAVATVDAARIAEEAPITSMADLLNSRTANVIVTSAGGTTGAGVRLRIRGSNSVSLSNEPVII
ncbi:MAG: carboxypeptidase-like regulatory domain-containing protein, partial [Dehalococcoidia bacterium]